MADLTPARLAELRRLYTARSGPIPELLDEIDRLRAVIRSTHYGCHILAKGKHQPDCKLHEIEP